MTASLETRIQVLTAERDEYQKAAVRTAVNCKFEYDKLLAKIDLTNRKFAVLNNENAFENLYQAGLEQEREITKLTKERDALRVAAEAYKVVRDTLTARLNQLETAGKLALDALDDWYYGANQDRPKAAVYVALQTLKAAGVS